MFFSLHIFSVSPCGSSPPFIADLFYAVFVDQTMLRVVLTSTFFLSSVHSSMSNLPAVYHDAQHFGQENKESAKQESNGLLTLESVSIWDSSEWSSFDDALYATSPLELIPETILDSIGKLLIEKKV